MGACMRYLTLGLCLCVQLVADGLSNWQAAENPPAAQVMQERIGTWTYNSGKTRSEQTGRLIEYTPADWNHKDALPLIVFLHGAGARTAYKDTIEALYLEFIPAEIRRGRSVNAILLCPQVDSYWGDQGAEILDQALEHYGDRIDPDRVYLTGLSSGGGGTWRAAVLRHEILAAAIPICGIRTSVDRDSQLITLPIWAFHNRHDPYQSVDYTRAHVQAIKAAGGQHIHYTEYEETPGHSHKGKQGELVYPKCHPHAWETAYQDERLWTWLFNQRKGKPERALVMPPISEVDSP